MQDRCSGVVVNTHDAWPHDGGQWRVYPINTVPVQGIVVEDTWVLADWFLPRPGRMGPCHYGHWLPTYGVSVIAQRSWVPTSLDWINLEISWYTYTIHVRDILLQEHYRQKPPHMSASRCCSMLPNCSFFFDGGSLHLFIRCAPWGSKNDCVTLARL